MRALILAGLLLGTPALAEQPAPVEWIGMVDLPEVTWWGVLRTMMFGVSLVVGTLAFSFIVTAIFGDY